MSAAVGDVVETAADAARSDRQPLLVLEPLARFLDGAGLGTGEIVAEAIGEGHSNVTYLLRRGEAEMVLRRPPRPPLPPSAHDVVREARLLLALQGRDVRTPRVLAVCDDAEAIGAPFYVMEHLHGHVVTQQMPAALDAEAHRSRTGDELIDSLIEVHAVDWRAAGLDWLGKPDGYLARQLRRFGELWKINKTRDLPAVERLGQWLADGLPESGPATIVHGDYRLGNVMLGSEPPARVTAIFDWELATLGDPLADVGYLCAFWVEPRDPPVDLREHISSVTREPGFPTRAQMIDRYVRLSGRSLDDIRWYVVLALWKAVVFMEGNVRRALAGTTDDPYLMRFEAGVAELAEEAERIASASDWSP